MKKGLNVRDTVTFGLLGAALVAVQVALAVLPNIELVSMLIIAYTLVLDAKALWPVYVFVLVEGLIYGFGLWFINYMYVWGLLCLGTLAVKRFCPHRLAYILLSAVFGLLFGALCSLPYIFIGGFESAAAFFVAGLPFDITHCAGNAAAGFLIQPVARLIERLYLHKLS